MAIRSRDVEEREVEGLLKLGMSLAVRGMVVDAEKALRRAFEVYKTSIERRDWGEFAEQAVSDAEKLVNPYLAQLILWMGDYATARILIDRAWQTTNRFDNNRDLISIVRLQGLIALEMGDLLEADKKLQIALSHARNINYIAGHIQSLLDLAELRRRQGDLKAAREFLEDLWDAVEYGPYPLFHADAFNILAQIERDTNNSEGAIEAATKAYHLAWCDGPPFAYYWGLELARKHLKELGASEPQVEIDVKGK